ncbi:hypothetical protein BHM03_00018635 [Ensete ventricosum]|nr:hypothetical protein BHM03_00018635 [Ensete ventricosum]
MWRAAAKLSVGAAVLGGGATAAAIATSDDPSTTFKICTLVPLRLLRDTLTVATIVGGLFLSLSLSIYLFGFKSSLTWEKMRWVPLYPRETDNISFVPFVLLFPKFSFQTINTHFGTLRREVQSGPTQSMKFTSDLLIDYRICVFAMEGYISSLVNILVNWWLVDEIREGVPTVTRAFAEMIFKHGFVHCDPHAANMMVRPLPSNKWNIFGKKKLIQYLCNSLVQ